MKRIYATVRNLFQRIGGVTKLIMFIFIYLMIYNNEVALELYYLNSSILMVENGASSS